LVRQRDFEGENPLESWTLQREDADADMQVDPQVRLNDVRKQSLRVSVDAVPGGGNVGVVNSGFWGIPVQEGEKYSFSLFVKGDARFAGKPLKVSLRNESLDKVYAEAEVGHAGADWQKLSCTLVPNATDSNGRLVISADAPGVFWLDMVSLFPPTYKDQPNGLRPDLVKMLADLKPSFFRFPGGCFAEGNTLEDAFYFHETIGPIEQRKGRRCFWNYNSTDGLGYYEYLRLTEDLGADPIFCLNPGGNNGVTEVVPVNELEPWLQKAVDAVEFAIGPADSEWGAKRAAMGHPDPFRFKTFYLQIGNETEFGVEDYMKRFAAFRDRIKAAYPGDNVEIIADSWGVGRRQSVDTYAIDFHEYMSWGRAIADRDVYDDAPRGEPYVFKGEYATRSGSGILQALSEAVFMMGLEENGDEVILAAYAPLFGNVNQCQWHPNLIYFDNHRVMGTISYYVQQLFSQHRGDRQLPVSVDQPSSAQDRQPEQLAGSVGFATWSTESEFDDLRVVVDGKTVYANDFADDASITDWVSNNNGRWSVENGVLRQSSRGQDARFWLPGQAWSKYEVDAKARKIDGAEGFMVMVQVENASDYVWANFGGWANSLHGVERAEGGAKVSPRNVEGSVETDRWYDVLLRVDGLKVVGFLDGEKVLDVDLATLNEEPEFDVYASAVTDDSTGDLLVRAVNIAETPKRVSLSIDGGESLSGKGTALTLAAEDRSVSQSLDDPLRYTPKSSQLEGVAREFEHELPPCSFTILRLERNGN
jgi:alpha-L-arabinofuranosidase